MKTYALTQPVTRSATASSAYALGTGIQVIDGVLCYGAKPLIYAIDASNEKVLRWDNGQIS